MHLDPHADGRLRRLPPASPDFDAALAQLQFLVEAAAGKRVRLQVHPHAAEFQQRAVLVVAPGARQVNE